MMIFFFGIPLFLIGILVLFVLSFTENLSQPVGVVLGIAVALEAAVLLVFFSSLNQLLLQEKREHPLKENLFLCFFFGFLALVGIQAIRVLLS